MASPVNGKPRKKSTPKWKLYIPKDPKVFCSIMVRMGNGRINLAENRLEAEKILATHRKNHEFQRWHPSLPASIENLVNAEEHLQEVPLDYTFSGPIKLRRQSHTRRGGVTSVEILTHQGFLCDISIADLLTALKETVVAEGMIFGTWGIKNISGEPLVYLIGGINAPDKQ